MPEGPDLEFKETLDPGEAKDRLILVKEIAAMANAGGGRILVGVRDDGTIVGIPVEALARWDPARIGNLLDSFLNPDHVELSLTTSTDGCADGRVVIEIHIPAFLSPPLVLSRDGNFEGPESPIFKRHAVLVRHNTRSEAADRSDFLGWRDDLRSRILQQFQMVVTAPETSHLRMVGDHEVRDEPNFLLSRAIDLFRQRPEKLLDGDDLLYLFRNRSALDLTADSTIDLLIQSALRRRATLFFWLAATNPTADHVRTILEAALGMSDRDKSDMAGAIPLLAALYLEAEDYEALAALMGRSSYAHIREAIQAFPTYTSALGLLNERLDSSVDGTHLSEFGELELFDAADRVAEAATDGTISRQLPKLGLELVARQVGHR